MRTRTKLIVAALLTAAISAGALLGGTLHEQGSAATTGPVAAAGAPALSADRTLSGIAPTPGTDTRTLEQAVQVNPADGRSLVLLGYAYQQRWRETADASYLPRSETALRRALRLDPHDSLAVTGLGSLALTRHEFRAALALGRRAQRLEPSSARAYGVIGDALLELGHYDQAFAAFERMVALKPSVASYARIAYARELLGDLPGAMQAMQLAADAATGQREPAAWTQVELAKLALLEGRLSPAERHLRTALELLPGYVYAYEQLARVEAARGHLRPAIQYARLAAVAVPLPQFVTLLADLQERAGNHAAAREQVATIGVINRLLAANGVRTDVESVVFDADRGIERSDTRGAGARRARRAALDRRRRRARVGARACRPLRRGSGLVAAVSPPRHA